VDPETRISSEGQRPDVALAEAVRGDRCEAGFPKLVPAPGERKSDQAGGVGEALEMLLEAKRRRAVLGLVAADSLEDRAPVVERMGPYRNRRFLSRYEPSIEP
jgi:hypothetical protein